MTNFTIADIRSEFPRVIEHYNGAKLEPLFYAINEIPNPTIADIRRLCDRYTYYDTAFYEALVRFVETKIVVWLPEV